MSSDFVDSNVILYMFDRKETAKRDRAAHLIELGLNRRSLAISYQVVQEVLSVMTRKGLSGPNAGAAMPFLRHVLMPMCRLMPTEKLYVRALEVCQRYKYSFYDSLIIASVLELGCKRLWSEDLQDGQRIDGLTIVNPFVGPG